MNSQPAPQPEAASKKWVIAFGVYLVLLKLLLVYVLVMVLAE